MYLDGIFVYTVEYFAIAFFHYIMFKMLNSIPRFKLVSFYSNTI